MLKELIEEGEKTGDVTYWYKNMTDEDVKYLSSQPRHNKVVRLILGNDQIKKVTTKSLPLEYSSFPGLTGFSLLNSIWVHLFE